MSDAVKSIKVFGIAIINSAFKRSWMASVSEIGGALRRKWEAAAADSVKEERAAVMIRTMITGRNLGYSEGC